MVDQQRVESLGPAERILQTLLNHADHMVHNRPGVVTQDGRSVTGVRWWPVTHKVEDGRKVVYRLDKLGRRTQRVRIGILGEDNLVRENGRVIGEYRSPGLQSEVVAYYYRQIAEVWKMDNEFVAHWASYAFGQEHRDLKAVLAAFMLVQSRRGDPVRDADGQVIFHDDDHREIGEAMCLIRRRDNKDLNPKMLLRVGDILRLPEVAEINRELGFSRSARNPALGRWDKAVKKWLRYRENNPLMLDGLVRAGFRKTVMSLAQRVGYKPESDLFFKTLRWKQKQSVDGRRLIAIGEDVDAAETWKGLSEREICERIVSTRPSFKRISGLLPAEIGLTRAIMAAAIQAGSVSNSDLIILTPTLEELGLLEIQEFKSRWETAILQAENQRAANIALRVKKKETIEALQEASDVAIKKAVQEVVRGLRVYVIVDKSGSMQGAIDRAKGYLSKFLQGFPLDKLHVSVFNTTGKEINIKHASAAGVEQAFRGERAGGGTIYAAGVKALQHHSPAPDEDTLMIFIGDQADSGYQNFAPTIQASGLSPVAFGLIEVIGNYGGRGQAVENTARMLGIPCFRIDEGTFDDPYAVTRTLRNLIASTPVSEGAAVKRQRKPLVETILETDLLTKPAWA